MKHEYIYAVNSEKSKVFFITQKHFCELNNCINGGEEIPFFVKPKPTFSYYFNFLHILSFLWKSPRRPYLFTGIISNNDQQNESVKKNIFSPFSYFFSSEFSPLFKNDFMMPKGKKLQINK